MHNLESDITKQVTRNKSLGTLEYYERVSDQEVVLHTSYGSARLLIYNPYLIRISTTLNGEFDDFNYAVVQQPQEVEVTIEENDDLLIIRTDKVDLEITRKPVRFSIKNKEGEVLNEDDTFGTSWIGEQVTTYKKLQKEERFVGLGEKTGHLDRFGKGYQNWNTDYFSYGVNADPLYMSVPFYIGIHQHGMYGIFFNNSYKTHFNFGASNHRFSSFSGDSGLMDYFFIGGDNVAEIIENYTWLTGRMPMPPKWSLGYQQCRYSYYPDKEVLNVANTFRDKDIPADAIVLDIHYMDEYKIFSWDPKRFPDPKKLTSELEKKGFNVVVMCDPGIKVEEGYQPYEEGLKEDIFIKYPDEVPYQGEVWPGWCHFPDFTKPKAREWWQKQMLHYTEMGVTGFWNDMNEIATWGNMLPELLEMDFDEHPASSRKGRNIYGMQMARSTYESAKENLGQRPFNLTRAGFSGVQRYAAVWTGDNTANDEHMLLGVRLVNSLGLSGVAFSGYDVGGFIDNANETLFARWISIGAFAPFFRGHSMINSCDSEPWAFGEEVEEISRNYIKLRYRLLPYIYSIFYESTKTGIPIARSLALYYSYDKNIYHKEFENQYLFGPSILVAPVASSKELTKVYLPEGRWYELYTDQLYEGGQTIITESPIEKLPVYIKGSSILSMQPSGDNTQHKAEILELHLYYGKTASEFHLYDDDGISFENENGKYHKRVITYNGENQLNLSEVTGSYQPSWKNIRLYTHGFSPEEIRVNGKAKDVQLEMYRFIQPISNFDPIGTIRSDELKIKALPFIEFPYKNEEITIRIED
jgi:alpha-glucosidase